LNKITKNLLPQYRIVALAFFCLFSGIFTYGNDLRSAPKNTFFIVDEQTPVISSGGLNSFCSGSFLHLTASLAMTYQWYKDGVLIPEATTQTYDANEQGIYTVHATYGEGPSGTSLGFAVRQGNVWTGAGDDDNWNTPENWSCGTPPQSNEHIDIIETTDTFPIISGESDLTIYSLSLKEYAQLNIESGSTLTVTDAIAVDPTANLIIEDSGSLVQVNDVVNTGSITAIRYSKPMRRFDFTYWSSPVSGQSLHDLSPNTLADKYFSYNPISGSWVTHMNGAVAMENGKGYIVRAPQAFNADVASTYTDGQFIGTPNNGRIETPIIIGSSDMNLIGNPYPSALDIDAFLTNSANAEVVDGTIYLWTHNSPPALIPGSGVYNYTSNDYATYNLMGGVATATDGNNEKPLGKIASGQSFFIRGIAPGNVVFDNSMRVSSQNAQFFRMNQQIEKDRIWLNLSNDQGAFKQTLVGFIEGATDGFDRRFDGALLNGNGYINFYSILDNKNYSIQGKGLPFDENESFPLGFSTSAAGIFTVGIAQSDDFFQAQNIYLFDNNDQSYHDLKVESYSFETGIGTFNTRFELRFSNELLGIENPVANGNLTAILQNQELKIKSSMLIENVTLSDLSGRILFEKANINKTEFNSANLPFQNQVFLVRIKTADGKTATKKLLMN
jgi:hypothetical protein